MRVSATTTERGVSLSFTGEGSPHSVALRNAELKNLTVLEGVSVLFEKLGILLDKGEPMEAQSDPLPLAPLEYLKSVGAL